ncbi:MAG: SUMF1/EgtB/PvdO family nonheme iron enzyme, partial [Kiritimatiellae bacterium]|nr:SUMF1/EgtB/PvdO family nonheme iron enzyme [Kiritimatiellia bacterium]
YWGDSIDEKYLWYCDNSDGKTWAVGLKQPNAWGLYDMAGNVEELCLDWAQPPSLQSYYGLDPKGPFWADHYPNRVCRGGGHVDGNPDCWTSYGRGPANPSTGSEDVGFRLVITLSN